jgi:replicative DNA helicase
MTVTQPNPAKLELALADERMLLGLCLLDPLHLASASERLFPGDLFSAEHQALFGWLCRRQAAGKSTELSAVLVDLVDEKLDGRVGGVRRVAELPDEVPSRFLDLVAITDRIVARSHTRRMLEEADRLTRACLGQTSETPDEMAALVAMELVNLGRPVERDEWTLGEALVLARDGRARAREDARLQPMATGERDLDEILDGGLRPGELVVVAGRPGTGKTALGLGLGARAAKAGRRVGFVSLEMGAAELSDRLLSIATSCGLARIRRGDVDDDEHVQSWVNYLTDSPVTISAPRGGVSLPGLTAIARRWKATVGLDLLVVDYLQLVHMPRAERRDLAVGLVATGCKQLARQLEVPVVLICQLNREFEKRGAGKRIQKQADEWWLDFQLPQLSDLRDSGQIEQDADVVLFPLRGAPLGLDLPSPPGSPSPGPDEHSACVFVAKNRNGRTGVAAMEWSPRTASYRLGGK